MRLLAPLLMALLAGCASARLEVVRPGGAVHPGDPAGLAERLLAGNIDSPGSAAYNRWGAGYDLGISASDRKFGL